MVVQSLPLKRMTHEPNSSPMKPLITLTALLLGGIVSAQTTHVLTTVGTTFSPDTIVAVQYDSLKIIFSSPEHTFTQVSPETWEANGNTPSGEYQIGPGVDSITIALDATGTIYYVCVPHAAMGMKGIVDVLLGTHVHEGHGRLEERFHPNPTNGTLWIRGSAPGMVDIFITDASGREVQRTQLQSDRPLDVTRLPAGLYTLRVVDSAGEPLFRQQVVRE